MQLLVTRNTHTVISGPEFNGDEFKDSVRNGTLEVNFGAVLILPEK